MMSGALIPYSLASKLLYLYIFFKNPPTLFTVIFPSCFCYLILPFVFAWSIKSLLCFSKATVDLLICITILENHTISF